MPLYFVLLRAMCSFFDPFCFTEVPGIILNILILCGLLFSFYGLAKTVLKNDINALLAVGILMFSYTVLSLEIYIRMYLLQMLLSVLLVWCVICSVERERVLSSYLFFLTVCNILCHYYSIIFCFFVTLFGCLILMLQKRNKQLFSFAGVMFLAVVVAYLIYPAMMKVGVYGERGAQFMALFKNLLKGSGGEIVLRQLIITAETIFDSLYIFTIAAGICLYGFLVLKTRGIKYLMLFLGGVFVLYSLVVGVFMPRMLGFQIRYFAPIIPIGVLLFVIIIFSLGAFFKIKKQYIYLFLAGCIILEIAAATTRKGNTFYFIGTRESRKMEKLVRNADIWWGLGGSDEHAWIIHNYANNLLHSDSVWILNDYDSKAFRKFAEDEKNRGKYAYLLLPKQQEKVPEGAVQWVKKTTGRQAYYLFTVKNDKMSAMVFEAAVFLVAPY